MGRNENISSGAQNNQRQRERLINSLINTPLVGIFYADAAGQFKYVNHQWCVITGLSEEQVLEEGQAWSLFPCGRDETMKLWRDAAKTETPLQSEIRLRADNEQTRRICFQVVAEYSASGDIIGHVGMATDISTLREAEEALEERNEFIETILYNLPIGFDVGRADNHQSLYINKRFVEIMGWPEEILKDETTFWDHIVPDPELRRDLVAKVNDDWESGDPERMNWEFPVVKSSGETAHVLATGIPMLDKNMIMFAVQDITQRRHAEAQLRSSEEQRIRLEASLELAACLQRRLLPVHSPNVPGFDIAACCLPAHHVGGDFFDWQVINDDRISLTLGDVMGKGVAAALLMATVRATLRAVIRTYPPAEAVCQSALALKEDFDHADSFVTLLYCQINFESRELTYVDCGHGHAFIRRAEGQVETLAVRGLPLGIVNPEEVQEGKVVLQPGDLLVMYSDGLIDAIPELELVPTVIASHIKDTDSSYQVIERLKALVNGESILPDDLTLLVVRCD